MTANGGQQETGFDGSSAPRSNGVITLGNRWLVAWLGVLVAATVGCITLFPLAFPLAPQGGWQLQRDEAIAIVSERIADLGELPPDPYVTAVLDGSGLLELHLLADLRARRGRLNALGRDRSSAAYNGELERQINTWLVSVYRRDAGPDDWMYRAELSLDGEVLSLQRGVTPGFRSRIQLTVEDATARADGLLSSLGIDLSSYYDPQERRIEMADFSYQLLQYERRAEDAGLLRLSAGEVVEQDDLKHGLEVRFAGGELLGFASWQDLDDEAEPAAGLVRAGQMQLGQFLTVFLLLPLVAPFFVRRYHRGLVGARRGTQVLALVFLASIVVVALTARSASEGLDLGQLTRANSTLGWVALLLLIYLPALSLVGGLSCAVGESLAQGTWRSRLATMDALMSWQWSNSTVAASSVRGVTAGMVLLVVIQVATMVLDALGASIPLSLQLGPWWQSAQLPGLSLLLVQVAFTTAALCFALLFLLPLLAQRIGVWAAAGVSALALAVLFVAPVVSVPPARGFPLVLMISLGVVALFLRYDFVVAWLAHLIASIGLGALTLLDSQDALLRTQGAAVFLVAAAPLWASLRQVSSANRYLYNYDDVPPHVRMIAERERQRVELETAKGIQTSILPELPATLQGVEVAYCYLPASEVGGDFYDAIALEDGRLVLAIGDVAGHGVSSGLIMSMTRAALAVQVHFEPEAEAVMEALNAVVYGSARRRLLTTLCYALLDPISGRLSYASAGHLHPYRIAVNGEVTPLPSIAYPLGVRQDLKIDCREITLDPLDTVFFCTDGLIETQRIGGSELFGFERLEASLRGRAGSDPSSLRDGVLEDLEQFAHPGQGAGHRQGGREDDLTVLVVRLPRQSI